VETCGASTTAACVVSWKSIMWAESQGGNCRKTSAEETERERERGGNAALDTKYSSRRRSQFRLTCESCPPLRESATFLNIERYIFFFYPFLLVKNKDNAMLLH
jgi:hypothetical protein